jgi:hypothetical protein
VFRQVCNLIPGQTIPVLAREHAIDARGFSATSHVQALIYGHVSHALSLNDICDALSVHASEFMRMRGATPPARNTFSHANRTRDPTMAEALYWQMLVYRARFFGHKFAFTRPPQARTVTGPLPA